MSALTSLLARDQVVPVRKIEEALQKQVVSGGEMSSVLLELDAVPENTLAAYCAALYQLLPATREEVMRVARDTIRIVPREIAERHRMVPLAVDGRTLIVAMAHPLDAEIEEQLGFLLGFDLVTRIVCDVRISAGLLHHYGVEATPRHVRLIERLRQRDPGAIPYVAPPKGGKIDRASLASQLPTKGRSVAPGFLDDEDDEDETAPSPRPAPVSRPSQVPEEGRPTDPMGFPSRDLGGRPAAPGGWARGGDDAASRRASGPETAVASAPAVAAEARHSETQRSEPARSPEPNAREAIVPTSAAGPAGLAAPSAPHTRPASIPPSPVVGVGVGIARSSPPTTGPSERPGTGSSEPPTETQRALRKLRGPLTAAVAVKMLEETHDRDSILELFFAFARQFFDYAALFVVHDDAADGRDAFGNGAPAATVRRTSVALDVPGAFGDARKSLQPRVGRLTSSEADRAVLRALAREGDPIAIVVPIAIRGRAVVLFYGDRSGDPFELSDVPELVAFVPRVVDAFERLILRKKRRGFAKPSEAPEQRDALKAAARAAALVVPPAARDPRSRAPSVPAIDPLAEAPAPAIPPVSALPKRLPAPLPAQPSSDSGSMWERADARQPPPAIETRQPRRTSSASLEAAGALAADLASSPAVAAPAKPAPIDVAAFARPGRTGTIRAMLGIPREAPPPPEAHVSLPPASEPPPPPAPTDDDEPELTIGSDDGDDEPELTVGSDDDDGERSAPLADDPAADGEGSPSPLPLTRARGAKPAPSTYILQNAAVDVVGSRKRRPSAPPPRASRDPRAEESEGGEEPVTKEVIHVPAIDARRAATPDERRERAAPPPASEEMPSVIVDMGDQINALVVDLSRCGPDDESAAVDALLRIGEAALPTLAQAFPGPTWFDLRRAYRRRPRGRDVSAIARALVAFRERAVPYVASILGSAQPDRRLCAVLVAGELVYPGILGALSERVFDDDDAVRAATLELLPRFGALGAEWSDALTVIRRAAKIRGRDPVRRRRAARALGAMRDPGALRILVDLLDEEDHELAEIAHRSLVEITCEDMGTATRRWLSWLQKNEGRHRIEWLIDALSHVDEAIRTSAGEELKALTQQYYGYHPASPRKEREVVQQKYRRWWDEEGRRVFAPAS